jgi:hypothetical protein
MSVGVAIVSVLFMLRDRESLPPECVGEVDGVSRQGDAPAQGRWRTR